MPQFGLLTPSSSAGCADHPPLPPLRQAPKIMAVQHPLSLVGWAETALESQDLRPARHHLLLLNRLEAIATGEIDRLMVLMPPGSAKSTYASFVFPAGGLHKTPASNIIAASHTAELAKYFGRRV